MVGTYPVWCMWWLMSWCTALGTLWGGGWVLAEQTETRAMQASFLSSMHKYKCRRVWEVWRVRWISLSWWWVYEIVLQLMETCSNTKSINKQIKLNKKMPGCTWLPDPTHSNLLHLLIPSPALSSLPIVTGWPWALEGCWVVHLPAGTIEMILRW